MRLGLSSAAAPDASLALLLELAQRRGMPALELRAGDAHGIAAADPHTWADARRAASEAGVALSAYRAAPDEDESDLRPLAAALETTVLLPAGRTPFARGAVLVSGADAVAEAGRVVAAGGAVAWEVHPHVAHAGEQGRTLLTHGDRLVHITLVGGGPEVSLQDGLGVGELMARIALAGWAGVLTVAPSSARFRIAWQQWLGRRGGTGCGSKQSEPALVRRLHPVT